jgi:hypothetical protein
LRDDMGQRRSKIGTGTGWPQMPHDLTRWHHTRGEQHPCAMTDVLVLAFFRFSWCNGLGGYLRSRICLPVFSSGQRTKRPCSKKRRACMSKEQMLCALASKSGA